MDAWNYFNIKCAEDLLRLPDMRTVISLMRRLGLSSQGIRKKDDAQRILLELWRESEMEIQLHQQVFLYHRQNHSVYPISRFVRFNFGGSLRIATGIT